MKKAQIEARKTKMLNLLQNGDLRASWEIQRDKNKKYGDVKRVE